MQTWTPVGAYLSKQRHWLLYLVLKALLCLGTCQLQPILDLFVTQLELLHHR